MEVDDAGGRGGGGVEDGEVGEVDLLVVGVEEGGVEAVDGEEQGGGGFGGEGEGGGAQAGEAVLLAVRAKDALADLVVHGRGRGGEVKLIEVGERGKLIGY